VSKEDAEMRYAKDVNDRGEVEDKNKNRCMAP